jgi:hypothetical protein
VTHTRAPQAQRRVQPWQRAEAAARRPRMQRGESGARVAVAGRHSQGAQKSTSTGIGDFSTSASNVASVTAIAAKAEGPA